MKKHMILFLAAALLTSCSDWLDVAPKDRMLEKDQFSSEDNINQAHNGLYREMTSNNLYGGQLSQTTVEQLAHYYTYASSDPGSQPLTRPGYILATFQYDMDDDVKSRIASIWSNAYATLLHINIYIKNLNESLAVMPEKHKNILLGEAYGLRAYLHFDLFRLFGPAWQDKTSSKILPYQNKTEIPLTTTQYKEREYSTADDFMNLLLADITEAEKLLENNDPIIDDAESITHEFVNDDFYANRNRRMNYYAIKGLEARVQQYRGEYQLAATAAKVVTDQMGNRFKWVDPGTVNDTYKNYVFFDEVVFGINNLDMDKRATEWYMGTEMTRSLVVDKNNLNGNIFSEYTGSEIGNKPDIRDRQWKESNVIDYAAALYSLDGNYVSKKYLFSIPSGSGDIIRTIDDLQVLMRTSEMYYIQAEAALKDNRKADACALLNEVLHHRGLTSQYDLLETHSNNEIQSHITREYYREFFGEGQIFFYHKRNGSTSMFNGNGSGSSPVPNPASSYVIPIPESETNV